ncbi:alanine racemase [Acidaminobacter sp. JC074]|uniref:alanine racemase n=1 Tax=Acidaminobacter sp. JC074 TaxID=2530199 RepID=UPI001F1044E1|nr:alanine racemase [Acidaminobacter sp. JC074]
MSIYGPAWLEVELSAIQKNLRACQNFVKNAKVLAVIKADAYGHGAVEVAKTMEAENVDYFGVATVFEAIELRNHGIKTPILVFSVTPKPFAEEAIKKGITLTVSDLDMARHIESTGSELKIRPIVHIKVETGMTRLGFSTDNLSDMMAVCDMDVHVEGLFTHFAKADSPDFSFTEVQARRFMKVADELSKAGYNIEIKHMSNSAAMMRCPDYNLDMVRAGGILFGHFCLGHFMEKPFEVKRAMSIRAVLTHINEVEARTGVSYGHLYETKRHSFIGVLPIGYTDGISRRNTNQTSFLLRGKRVPQIGLMCMDQMMIDVTDVACEVGDVVTLLGEDGEEITLEERAGDAGIGKAELFACIGRRLPKVYFVEGHYKNIVNYLLQ